jgi:hypothetical protein
MDLDSAIAINHAALARIVAGLMAMVGLASERLPRPVHRAVLRILRPAEAAVRRLIIIAARDVVVTLRPSRSKPQAPSGNGKKGGGGKRSAFQLFDSRKTFGRVRRKKGPEPRIWTIGLDPAGPVIGSQLPRVAKPEPELDGTVASGRLHRRLAAIRDALENLAREAKRLARWQARRERMERPKFRSPIRPGPPPGHRKKPRRDIDFVLAECHTLAWGVLHGDTS